MEIIWSGGVKFLFQKIFQVEILVLFVREYTAKHCLTTDNVIRSTNNMKMRSALSQPHCCHSN